MSLSNLLVQREIATIRDVEEALSRQVLYGGDLVTNLLEAAGNIDEARLSEALGDTTGLRPASAGAGPLPPAAESARAFVARELADTKNIFPLALTEDGEQLVIAVSEPLSAEEDERLMFALGIPTVQRVAPLVRIREALARDYGLPLDRRQDRLLRLLRGEPVESMSPPGVKPKVRANSVPPTESAAPPTIVERRPGPVPRTTIAAFPAPQRVDASPPSPRAIPTPKSALTREGGPTSKPARRRRAPLTFDAAKRELETVEDRDGLIDLFFDFSRQHFDYAALFVVHGDIAEGRDAYGSGAPRDRVSAIGVPLDLPSLLSVAKERAVPVVATPQAEGIDAMFTGDLGRPRSGEIIVVPLVVRRRTVALLYGDSNDSGVAVENPSDVTIFALLVGQAFERMIVKKKTGSSDRSIPRFVQVSAREAASADRTQRALALSRAMQDVPPGHPTLSESNAPAAAEPETPRDGRLAPSPAAVSVVPPGQGQNVGETETAPPPANVVTVRRPSGPPIPREDPVDATTREPEQIFVARRMPSQAPQSARRSQPPIPREEPSDDPRQRAWQRLEFIAEPKTDPSIPAMQFPQEDADIARARSLHQLDGDVAHEPSPDTLASPATGSPATPRAHSEDAANAVAEASAPELHAVELTPETAGKILAEIASEEIDGDRIEESAPVSVAPPSQTVVVAPRRPPTSRTDTEDLPTIMVDVSAELEVLVRDIVAGKNEDRAEEELLRQGAAAMPAILASFPGPTRNEPSSEQETFPPFSGCGAVLRLVASQRKVALPYILPLVVDEREDRRFWATFSLTELAYPEATPVLIPRLFDTSARIRHVARLAVAAVSRVHGEHVARELGRFARDVQNDRLRRLDIVRLLEDVREPMAVPTFIALVDDPDREIGESALHALEVITRQQLGRDTKKWKSWWNSHSSRHRIEWLVDALLHESLLVRRSAGDELKAITKEYFGYYPDEPKRDREKAQARYREWWSNEGRLKFVVS